MPYPGLPDEFNRAEALLKRGECPSEADLRYICETEPIWLDYLGFSEKQKAIACWENTRRAKMTVASQLVAVNEWLAAIGDQPIYIGVNGGTEPMTKERLLNLARRCEWARIETDSRLPGVFPQRLVMGYGDFLDYCRSGGTSQTSQAYWLTASAH